MFTNIQNEVIKKYHIIINTDSDCWGRTHAHIRERKVCKWKQANGIISTFTLLHEIGHIENNNSKMRRCEQEYYATVWALNKCKEYGIQVPKATIDKYQRYIYRELDRGLQRGGLKYPSREEMNIYEVIR